MLSWFASDYFAKSPVLIFPMIALGIFMTVFLIVSMRAMLTKKEELDRLARLPLEDDDE